MMIWLLAALVALLYIAGSFAVYGLAVWASPSDDPMWEKVLITVLWPVLAIVLLVQVLYELARGR
jgi:hypothetical protein